MKKTTLFFILTISFIVCQAAFAGPKRSAPDAATTSLLLTGSIAGLAVARNLLKR